MWHEASSTVDFYDFIQRNTFPLLYSMFGSACRARQILYIYLHFIIGLCLFNLFIFGLVEQVL